MLPLATVAVLAVRVALEAMPFPLRASSRRIRRTTSSPFRVHEVLQLRNIVGRRPSDKTTKPSRRKALTASSTSEHA